MNRYFYDLSGRINPRKCQNSRYVFSKEYVPAMLMREKLHSIKHIFGVEKPDRIFPVQKYLDLDKGSAGSWINIPYYN